MTDKKSLTYVCKSLSLSKKSPKSDFFCIMKQGDEKYWLNDAEITLFLLIFSSLLYLFPKSGGTIFRINYIYDDVGNILMAMASM